MSSLPALAAALLLPAAQPVLLSAAVSSAALLVAEAPAQAQTAEAGGKVAKAITVRIEGATQGSGVLVKRDGNRYTVLTAWHVVSSQRAGEELDVITSDGKQHSVRYSSIRRIDRFDLAALSFYSSEDYLLASVSTQEIPLAGAVVTTCGFLVDKSQVGLGPECTANSGTLVAFSTADSDRPATISYNSSTGEGFSGGPVLDVKGNLIGIHAKGFVDRQMSEARDRTVKTGINEAQSIYSESFVALGLMTQDELVAAQGKLLQASKVNLMQNVNSSECSQKSALDLRCQGRSRQSSGQVLVDTGKFNTLDIARAKERRCNRTSMMIVNTMFNLALPWNWFKKVDNNCVGYTFKARFYAESSAKFCGVIVSRYGPNYQMTTTKEDYAERDGKLESDLLRLWDELESDRRQGRAYLSRRLVSGTLSLGSGVSARFLPSAEVPNASPVLLKGSNKLFHIKERHRSQGMVFVKKLKEQEARSDNLILASLSTRYYGTGLSLFFDDGSSFLMKMGAKDLNRLRDLLKRCL